MQTDKRSKQTGKQTDSKTKHFNQTDTTNSQRTYIKHASDATKASRQANSQEEQTKRGKANI